jgi:hypothetical protein
VAPFPSFSVYILRRPFYLSLIYGGDEDEDEDQQIKNKGRK